VIRPLAPKPSLFPEPSGNEAPVVEAPPPAAFIPPAPERVARAPRMPRIDDLPLPAQIEVRASRGEPTPTEHPEKRRLGLLQRLASVGLGRRDDDAADAPAPASLRPPVRPMQRTSEQRNVPRPMAVRPDESRPPEPVSDYAKRPLNKSSDAHGRQVPVHNSPDDDQLEIPAFLRRQAT
jgi:cell division protein FtsZ